MKTNIKMVLSNSQLELRVRRIQLEGENLSIDQIERLCNRIGKINRIAAVPFIKESDQSVFVQADDLIEGGKIIVDSWIINLVPTTEITLLSFKRKMDQPLIASLFKKSLLLSIKLNTKLWTLSSPRIFYQDHPFSENDFSARKLSQPVSDIDAYRRYDISDIIIDNVGLGFSIGVRTSFFTNLSLDDYYKLKLVDRLKKLMGRQSEQKGTLVYDGPNGRLTCYFENYRPETNLGNAPGFTINGNLYDSPYNYFSKEYPSLKVNKQDRAILVSFSGMDQKVYVPAKMLFVRVMNDMVDSSLNQADKIHTNERMKLLNSFWHSLGKNPFGRNYSGISDEYFETSSINSGIIPMPNLIFGKDQILPTPIDSKSSSYKQNFKSRKDYLNKFGCYYVPPAINKNLIFVFPANLPDGLYNCFTKSISEKINTLAKLNVKPIIIKCKDYQEGIRQVQNHFDPQNPGTVIFVFDEHEPNIYYNIRFELSDWKIKRLTTSQLSKKFRGLNDFKDHKFPKGEKNWNSFIEINAFDIIQQMGCLPYIVEPTLNYDMQLMIDVSAKSTHIALSLVMYKKGMPHPIFNSLIKPKTDSFKEKINHVFLEKYLTELLVKNKNAISRFNLNSLLILRDGKNCGKEYEAIKSTIEKLKSNGILDRQFRFNFVEYHKSTQKEIRLFRNESGQYQNVIEGSYFLIDKETAILSTTGDGTLSTGTASPLLLKGGYDDCNLIDVLNDVFIMSQLNYSNPLVAQRLTFAAKRADEQLKDRLAQEVMRLNK